MNYYILTQDFKIVQAIYGEYSPESLEGFVKINFDGDLNSLFEEHIWLNSELKYIGPPPKSHGFYVKSATHPYWLPNLDAAREAKLQSVATELNARLYLPCNGFDADKVSRDRIGGTIARLQRGDGLPAGWLGWRDAENNMHWAEDDPATVLANLTALSRAIEDREQVLLIAGWTHKANIAALEDIDAILAYDVTAAWPT